MRSARALPLRRRAIVPVPEPILDGREQRRQRERGVGRDRQVHGDQRLERLRPAPGRVVLEGDRDDAGALVEQAHLARAAIDVAERAQEVRDVEGEDEVGLAHHLVSRAAHVERMTARDARSPLVLDGQVHERRREELGETAERRRHAGTAPEGLHHDHRKARVHEPAGRVVDGARVGVRRRRRLEAPDVGHRYRTRERLLLQARVETQVDGTLRLRAGEAPCAEERLGNGGDARRLVVQLDVVPDLGALHQRGVDPVDPGPALGRVHRAGGAEHQDGDPVAEGVEDGHARVLEADDVVDDGRHRPPLGLGVAVREGDGDLLVRGEHQLGSTRASIVHEGVVKAAERRPRVDRDVLDADGAQEIDDEIGPVARRLVRRRHQPGSLLTLPEPERLTAELLGRRIPGERRVV